MNQSSKFMFNSKQSCYILIDYYKHCNPIGKIINSESVGHDYYSMTSLLNLISEIIDPMGCVSDRHFIDNEEVTKEWSENTYPFIFNYKETRGHVATFKITVLFTQRNSWQGVIKWIEADKELCFRSVYELINLIDNACMCNKKVSQVVSI